MPTLSQAVDDLRRILGGPPPAEAIDLVAAARQYPSLGGLSSAINLFGAPNALVVSDARLTPERQQAVLTGNARVPLTGMAADPVPVSVALTLTEPAAGSVLFSLALTVTVHNWTMGTTFPGLPDTLRANTSGAEVSWGPSALAGLAVSGATFTASSAAGAELRLSGMLLPSGELLAYRDWVGPWPLALTGTVVLPVRSSDSPMLNLRAVSPQGTIGVQPLRLRRPGFALISAKEPHLDDDEPDPDLPAAYSEIRLIGTAELGGADPVSAELSATLLVSRRTWRLMAGFGGGGPSLAGGLAQLAALFGVQAGNLRTPPALGGFESFRLNELEVWLSSANGETPTGLQAIAATVRSDRVWEPPVPFLKVFNVGTRWVLRHTVLRGTDRIVIAGSVFGSVTFPIDSDENSAARGIVDISGLLPSFVVTGQQRAGTSINLSAAVQQLFGHDTPPLPGDPSITDMTLSADPFGQLFDASATVNLNSPLSFPLLSNVSITQVSFEVSATASSLWGGLEGRLRLGNDDGSPELLVRAETPRSAEGGWTFSGGIVSGVPLTLRNLVALAGPDVPEFDALRVSRLEASVETGENGPWSFAGAIGVAFHPTIFGMTVNVAAGMELELARKATDSAPTGWVAGELTVNRLLIRMRRDLGAAEPVYALRVQFAGLWLQAATAWHGDEGNRHQVIALTLGGVTLGEVLEELVALVAPTLDFRLEPPWDLLNRIDLSRFTLTVDPADRVIGLSYEVKQDLLFMYVDTIGVKATLGNAGQVDLTLTGSLLGHTYTDDKPLGWDVVNDPPPALPGKGPRLFELRYAALGQRLRLPDPPETVAGAIDALRIDMQPPKPGTDPLVGSLMKFDSSSELLAALDLSVLETVQVALVFNDPLLYGLFVALDGEKAGKLAGLRFEVLYKRLPSGIGMFRTELRVPEHFRRIEFGEVSIGLAVIVVEVYTNGNFLVDLGFPHDRDFTRSFDVMVFPFLGRGGIYFGVLNGETSRRVPAIGNGTFSPVLELGIGLSVGVGKEIEEGPLSGGAYVELEVIFEGVLAWFNPSGQDQATALYYRAQGIVAIHGKVYATVDFTVVKATVTLEAYAQASVVFEAHRATVFGLYAYFEAEAEIEIASFMVSFSFSVELDLSFAVGSDSPTPWAVSAAQPPRLAARRAPRRLTRVQRARALLTAGAGGLAVDTPWNWAPDFPAFTAPRTVGISLLPAFTVQHPAVSWTSATPPAPAAPGWQVVLPLFARNGVSPAARTAREARAVAFDPGSPVAAASLVEALLRWAISGLPGGVSEPGKVTAGELALLGEELAKPYVAREQFTRDRLATFFGTNLHLRISGPAGEAEAAGEGQGAMVFPAPPWITIGCDPGGSADLFTLNPVGPTYSAGAGAYLAGFGPVGTAAAGPEHDVPADYQSFAARVFCDWSLMVAREAVRKASASLASTTVAMAATLDATAATLPTDLVRYRVRPGDTLQAVAAELGAGSAELAALNPNLAEDLASAQYGEVLNVQVGVAGCTLAADNATRPLESGLTVTLTGVRVQVRSQDTLNALATRLYGSAQAGTLVAAAGLADNTRLLRAGALVPVPQRQDPLSGSADPDLLAGVMYVRYFAPADVPNAEWYAQAIAEADSNRAVLSSVGPGQPLPAGQSLTVPVSYLGPLTASYEVQPGDTLLRVGAALALAQAPAGYQAQSWTSFRAAAAALGGSAVPATPVAVLPGESLATLAARLLLAGGTDALVALLAAEPALEPLAQFTVNALPLSTTTYTTLTAMAQLTGLTVAEVAAQPGVTGLAGLFAAGTPLTVTHLPAQTIDALAASVCGGAALGEISGRSSRSLLAGIRLPAPQAGADGRVTATGPLTGAFKLAGQQFDAPARDTTGLTVTVGPSTAAQSWITFAQTPDGPQEAQLSFSYTGAELAALYPESAFARPPHAGPAAIPVAGTVPRTYGLEQRVELQLAQPPMPGANPLRRAGTATLWRLPTALLAKARAASTTPFDILRAGPDGAQAHTHDVVADATFATVVSLRIRRVRSRGHAYELLGADQADALLLRELALSAATGQPPSLALAMAPAPGAGPELSGLTVFDASGNETFVIRANMATDLPLAAPPAVVSAGLAEPANFLRLLWEASLGGADRDGPGLGGPGYHLGFATADGTDFPVGAFDADGTALLWLIAVPDAQDTGPDGRMLHPADNCALIAPGLDAPLHALYVEAHDAGNQPGELVTQALVPAGSAGVTLTLPRGDDATARLFSLLVTRIAGDAFSAAVAGPAAPPQREDGQHLPRWVRERQLRAARAAARAVGDPQPAGYWRYDQVVPLHRYANAASPLPDVPGLPRPADDPYRGFGAGTALAHATFWLGLADVFGNVSEEPSSETVQNAMEYTDVTTGYTDPLLGPAAWPATATGFSVKTADDGVTLMVTVTAQPSNAVPGPADPLPAAAEAAGQQAARYAEAVFQLAQPTVHGTLLTTLVTDGDGQPAALPLTEGLAPLQRYAAASYVAADAASLLVPPPLTDLATLADVSARFGLPLTVVGTANTGTPVGAIVASGQAVTVTARMPVVEGDSAATLLQRVPSGWPAPAPSALLQNAANAALPLRVGTVLAVPRRDLALGPNAPQEKLADLAALNQTSAAQLAIDSKDLAVLSPGFAFEAAGQTVTVDGAGVRTFADVQSAFAALAVDVAVAELADAAADRAGLFAAGATLTQTHVVAVAGDTLASLFGSAFAAVATAAAAQPNLWAAGTQVTLGQYSPPVDSSQPLGQFAERHGSTAALLLAENPALRLADQPALVLPGTCAVPAAPARPLRSTYTIAAGDTLELLRGLFGTLSASIAADNQHMPDVLVPGRPVAVSVGTQRATTTTQPGDTLATLTARLKQQVAAVDLTAVASAISADPAILAEGGLLVLPLAMLANRGGTGDTGTMTLPQVAAAYQVDWLAFAQANAALCGVLAPGVTLTVPGGPAQTTAQSDTLNAVLTRCAAAGAEVDLATLLTANWEVALFQAGAPALLPPSPVTVSAPLGAGAGPFPQPVFPLTVTLRLERDQAVLLIDEPAVRRADTVVLAPADKNGALGEFVTAFEAALPALRLGTARVSGERADLWAVNFGPAGVTSVAVAPGVEYGGGKHARFLALRPLYPALQSRTGVLVPVLDASGAITAETTTLEVQGADVEAWARQLLADVDLFLSAPYAAGLYGHAGLDDLLRAKWTLTRAVARGLAPVLAVPDARWQEGVTSAANRLARDLGASLAAAYDVAAIVQYDATADTAYGASDTALRPARLSGGARPPAGADPSGRGYALSAAGTELAAPASFVSFAMAVSDPAGQQAVATGPLEYVYDAVEFGIDATVDAPDGYESSDWLHFIRPLSGTRRPAGITGDLGAPQVPVPLRAYPPVPVLVEQAATPAYRGPGQPTLTQAAQWTYGVTYSHEHAAQDEVLLAVTFNARPGLRAPLAAELDLAAALARYAALGDQLRRLMTAYLDPDDPRADVRAAVAGTVGKLVGDVAAAWDAHWPAQPAAEVPLPHADVPPGDTRRYLVALDCPLVPGGGRKLDALSLTLDAGDPAPDPEGWPAAYVQDTDGEFVELRRTAVSDRQSRYTPARLVQVSSPRVVRLEWPGLNVAAVGNALASVSARRNASLTPDAGTNPSFVLSTAAVTAPDIATPLLTWTAELPLTGADLRAAVESALRDLFAGASGPPVTLGLAYGHQLVAPPGTGGPGLKSFLPVALYPGQPLSPELAAALAETAANWAAASRPAPDGGEWVVSLTLSSWLEPASSRPLLVIDRLVLPL